MLRRHWKKIVGGFVLGSAVKLTELLGAKFTGSLGRLSPMFDYKILDFVSYMILLGLLFIGFIEAKAIWRELEAHRKTWKDLEDAQKARLEQFLAERYSFVDAETKKRLDNSIDKWDERINGIFEDCEKKLQVLHHQYEARIDTLEKFISKS